MSSTENPPPIVRERIKRDVKFDFNISNYLNNRSQGMRNQIGHNDNLNVKLYDLFDEVELKAPIKLKGTEDSCPTQKNLHYKEKTHGGIFNLEFSLDGRILLAACEKKQVMMFDTSSQQWVHTIGNAHKNCVNCIRFLDDRNFATCSDDMSIKLWDIRNLKVGTKTLHGHSNWVKNIEYSESESVLVTSAFDGSIYAWNLKSPTENGMLYDRVFLMNGLMRTKLTPDGSKMLISTTNGFMIIIHDLHLPTLATDLRSFRPNLYRLMQISDQNFPVGAVFNYLFHPSRRKNRIEFVADFPEDAEVISSLQIHPHGWCTLTRNVSGEECQEFSSVHDIQKRDPNDYEAAYVYIEEEPSQFLEDEQENPGANPRPTDLWMGYISFEEYTRERAAENIWEMPAMGIINSGLIGRNSYNTYFRQNPDHRNKVVKNLPRLTHYIKEKNVGKGYIKELCFSSEGRIICSPYGKGIRLLGFNDKFQELTYCVPDSPRELTTLLELNDYHSDVVVSCKFNPVYLQLVSGCLGGDIKWYQPVL